MRTLPPKMVQALDPFAPLFSKRVWQHVQVLLAGTILAPGRRTVSSALRAMGLDQEKRFHRYHRVLSRASWSSLKASRVLLGLLVKAFVPEGDPLVVGIDETLERRWGKRIAAKGVYRDPVRSTHENFVKSSGLRWVCVMLLVGDPLGRAGVGLALPFCPGSFRALCHRAGRAPQEDNRVGLAVALGGVRVLFARKHTLRRSSGSKVEDRPVIGSPPRPSWRPRGRVIGTRFVWGFR